MDNYHNQRDSRGNQLNSGRHNTPGLQVGAPGEPGDGAPVTPERGQQQPTNREPQHTGVFTVIPPNESQRRKTILISQKEEEDLKRWKEANRPSSVHTNPEKLGGHVTLAEAREKQSADLRSSKLRKKLMKAECDKKRRQEEEEELEKMKAVQREKAEQQEQRRRQEEQRRRELHRQDHLRATESLVQRFERMAEGPLASSSATHTSSRSEAVGSEAVGSSAREKEAKSVQDVQLEHRRVNASFLDRLEGRGRGGEKGDGVKEEEPPFFTFKESSVAERRPPFTHLDPGPEQSLSDWTQEGDSDPDSDWALKELMSSFPNCCKMFLEEILDQCNGDYDQAYALLISTLT
ncbi:epithelial-stromal interaction protein 1 [Labrus bergylta]|uniref:epithelial-stromal interaction protein 1 n=1 Tax=Labrus bergylta TaxID=56723 RepID=UPI0009B2EE7A|nr:epithelial-stromal interaction protein 1-like [Labrus bergylta]